MRLKLDRIRVIGLACTFGASVSTPAHALGAPASEPRLGRESPRFGADRFGLTLRAEYRTALVAVSELDLAERDAAWFEQRLRVGAELDHDERIRLVTSADVLDGIFGAAGGVADSGARVLEAPPGTRRLVVGPVGDGDPTEREAYDLMLEPGELTLRRAYLEVVSGLGVLRIGRMAPTEGMSLIEADGESGQNRFGVAGAGDTVERIQATFKPLSPLDPEAQADPRGARVAAQYDRLATSDARLARAANRLGVELRILDDRPVEQRAFDAGARASIAWAEADSTRIGLLAGYLSAKAERVAIGAEGVYVSGGTRRVSESLAVTRPEPPTRQRIEQWGSRVVARWDDRRWTAYLELDYASGDRTPEPRSSLTRFDFARDANVGLLLFERVLAFESARSAAAGAARLRALGSPDTLAADRAATGGAFTSAVALFPQFDLRPIEPLLVRGGVLFAWAPDGLADPVLSLASARPGAGPLRLADPVGPRGGAVEGYLGTELDVRVAWRYTESFRVEVEGAVLVPGEPLEDARGRASTSSFATLRAEVAF